MIALTWWTMSLINCRIGSLEMPGGAIANAQQINCRIGSLESVFDFHALRL